MFEALMVAGREHVVGRAQLVQVPQSLELLRVYDQDQIVWQSDRAMHCIKNLGRSHERFRRLLDNVKAALIFE